MLAGLRLNKAKMQLILGFVDTYLRLSAEENDQYVTEVEKLAQPEKESVMELEMSWREQALNEGLRQGMEQGVLQGVQRMAALVTHQIEKRLGSVPATQREKIAGLNADQIERLADALLDFQTIDQLDQWLKEA